MHGERQLESVVIEDPLSGEDTEVATHNLFIMIGAEPHTAWLEDTVLRDRRGFIPTGEEISAAVLSDNDWATQGRGPYLLETSLPGEFAVGDVRANSVKRVAAAVGEGSMACALPRSTSDTSRHELTSEGGGASAPGHRVTRAAPRIERSSPSSSCREV
jgi:thioredoxin reductase (NADPH)